MMDVSVHNVGDSTKDDTARQEATMIASILAGQTQLFHELIRPHERAVYRMALSYMKNEADTEEVAQEAFLKAFRNLATFRGKSKFSTWLIILTLSEAHSRLRRAAAVPTDLFLKNERKKEDA